MKKTILIIVGILILGVIIYLVRIPLTARYYSATGKHIQSESEKLAPTKFDLEGTFVSSTDKTVKIKITSGTDNLKSSFGQEKEFPTRNLQVVGKDNVDKFKTDQKVNAKGTIENNQFFVEYLQAED